VPGFSVGAFRTLVSIGVAASLAFGVSACGGSSSSSKKKTDPVTTAVMTPGVRTVVIPKQRNDISIVVPPCSEAQLSQELEEAPPGSNEIVVPENALTETVAIQPCSTTSTQSGGSTQPNTILLTPGGAGTPPQTSSQQNQLVIPDNSRIETVIVPPCTSQPSGQTQQSGSTALPAGAEDQKSVTAPPCAIPKPPPSG
jgi:hypothetical protein